MKTIITITLLIIGCGDELPIDVPVSTAAVDLDSSNKDGKDGRDGLSCTVIDDDDGSSRIVCEDGTEATVWDGEDGETGETGIAGEQGEKGDTGSVGMKGENGAAGQKGEKGVAGEKGDKGDTGAAGAKGVAGAKGDTGATGDAGAKGDKGDQGVAGTKGDTGEKGDTGAQGADGVLSLPIVQDGNGLDLGRLAYMTPDGDWAVLMDGGLRAKIGNNGYPENIKTYFSGSTCNGERRAVLTNGTFGNFALDNLAGDGTFWKVSSNNLGSFAYQSREDGDGVCDTVSGTIASATFQVTTGHTFSFTVPFGTWPRIKEIE